MNSFFSAVGGFILRYPLPFLFWVLFINLIAFLLFLIDKYKARKNLWRIPEATLLLFPALGGGIGALLGMYLVRHKTKHLKFLILVPLFFLLYTAFFGACLILAL